MSKNIALLPRRAGLTRARFHDYYERHHAPLAIGHFPLTRYVRNHLADGADLDFDTISEFWSDDLPRLAALMQTEVGDLMRADEARFMDRARIRSGSAREHLLSGPARGVESANAVKFAWLLRREPGTDEAGLVRLASSWSGALAEAHGAACERLTLDLVNPWPGVQFPFDSVLWLWMSSRSATRAEVALGGVRLWREVAVTAVETPPAEMAAALRRQSASH